MSAPEHARRYRTGPSSGYLLPSLELRTGDGGPAPLWEWRGRGPLVVFLHAGPAAAPARAYLDALATGHPDYRALGAQVLAIGLAPVPGLPYPTLVDAEGRLAARLARDGILPRPDPPALLVVGRTGEVWAVWVGDYAALPDQVEIMGWLEYALSECRECFCCELVWPASWVQEPSD